MRGEEEGGEEEGGGEGEERARGDKWAEKRGRRDDKE